MSSLLKGFSVVTDEVINSLLSPSGSDSELELVDSNSKGYIDNSGNILHAPSLSKEISSPQSMNKPWVKVKSCKGRTVFPNKIDNTNQEKSPGLNIAISTASQPQNRIEQMLSSLIDNGLNPDIYVTENYDALNTFHLVVADACTSNNLSYVLKLLKIGANPDARSSKGNISPLLIACASGSLSVARALLEYGANPNLILGQPYIDAPWRSEDVKAAEKLNHSSLNNSRDIDLIDFSKNHFLTQPINESLSKVTNPSYTTAIHECSGGKASVNKRLNILKLLLLSGADIDLCTKSFGTPLHVCNSIKICHFLLSEGCIPRQCGPLLLSPLHTTAMNNQLLVAKFLHYNYPTFSEKYDKFGYLPLHTAAAFGSSNCFKFLLKNSSNKKTLLGNSAEDIAKLNLQPFDTREFNTVFITISFLMLVLLIFYKV